MVDSVQFGKILIAELNNSTFNYYNSPARNYSNEEEKKKTIKEELEKVGRIISKTGITH